MNVVGFDPGFAAFGIAVVRLAPAPDDDRVLDLDLIATEKASKKRRVRASDDNVERARIIAGGLHRLLLRHKPVAICAESMSFPRSASVAAKMALAWGCISTLALLLDLPLLQATPQEIKVATTGAKSASKEQVREALRPRLGRYVEYLAELGSDAEHPVDALGAVVACLPSEPIRMARRLVRVA